MKAYIARLNTEHNRPRELAGFFVARDTEQLCDLIDECCHVDAVEILELGAGSIYWGSAMDFVVPHPRETQEEAPGLPGDASVSDLWLHALFDENEDEWQQLAWPKVEA